MRASFFELPAVTPRLPRPALPVEVDGLEGAPQIGLIDTGSVTNRFAAWIAEAAGVDLADAPAETLAIAGMTLAPMSSIDRIVVGWSMRDSWASSSRWPMPSSRCTSANWAPAFERMPGGAKYSAGPRRVGPMRQTK